ncbi:MAG TPA: STAS domain-containing protein [Euzebyales bacterium]|nr:STAS domain-containing protein [Euzebyales bacterium]
MAETMTTMNTRAVTDAISVIDIVGDVVPSTEDMLLEAFAKCEPASTVVLNFTDLAYMNSGGIGLLVTMLVRAQRNGQALRAYGLSDHYCHIFQLTRLDETIRLHDSEVDAIAAVET